MRKTIILIAVMLGFAGGCNRAGLDSSKQVGLRAELEGPAVERDLAEIKADGKLKAIMIYSSTSYFLYRGQAMGFEYELLQRLADDLDLELEIVLADNIDQVFDLLNSGEGDLIAYGLTITEERKDLIDFSDYLYTTHQALVQRKPKNWRRMTRDRIEDYLVRDVIDLIDDTVHVHRKSSYYERLLNLQEEIGAEIHIDTIVGDYNIEDVIKMVVNGEIRYAVADHNIASINQTFYPILDVETPMSFSQRIAWGLRKNSPQLLAAINEWVNSMRKRDTYHFIYDKYYVHKKSYKRRVESDFYSKNSGQISLYDPLIKEAAAKLNWDWRLLASVIYQESRFDPSSTSWAGAGGLMQLMPSTAQEMGLSNVYAPEANIRAGSKYLKQLYNKFDHIEDSIQRIKFTLASYNCGYGHLLDAQRLASRDGKDSLQYDNSVEIWLKKLGQYKHYSKDFIRYGPVRGNEPFHYVRDIFLRFEHYRRLIPLNSSEEVDPAA